MGKGTVATLIFDLKSDTTQLVSGMNKAQKSVDKAIGGMKKTILGLGAAYLSINSIKGFSNMVSDAVDAADATGKLAQKLGYTSKTLSEYQYAIGYAAIQSKEFNAASGALIRRLNNFQRDGGGAGKKGFEALGITADFARKNMTSTDAAMKEVLKRLEEMPDGYKKTAAAQDIFSKNASSMLRLSYTDLEKFSAEAEKIGVSIPKSISQMAAVYHDEMDRLDARFEGIGKTISFSMLPAMTAASQTAVEMYDDMFGGVGEQMDLFEAASVGAVEAVVRGAGSMVDAWSGVELVIVSLERGFYTLAYGVAKVFDWIYTDNINGFVETYNSIADAMGMKKIDAVVISSTYSITAKMAELNLEAEKLYKSLANEDGAKGAERVLSRFHDNLEKNMKKTKEIKDETDDYTESVNASGEALKLNSDAVNALSKYNTELASKMSAVNDAIVSAVGTNYDKWLNGINKTMMSMAANGATDIEMQIIFDVSRAEHNLKEAKALIEGSVKFGYEIEFEEAESELANLWTRTANTLEGSISDSLVKAAQGGKVNDIFKALGASVGASMIQSGVSSGDPATAAAGIIGGIAISKLSSKVFGSGISQQESVNNALKKFADGLDEATENLERLGNDGSDLKVVIDMTMQALEDLANGDRRQSGLQEDRYLEANDLTQADLDEMAGKLYVELFGSSRHKKLMAGMLEEMNDSIMGEFVKNLDFSGYSKEMAEEVLNKIDINGRTGFADEDIATFRRYQEALEEMVVASKIGTKAAQAEVDAKYKGLVVAGKVTELTDIYTSSIYEQGKNFEELIDIVDDTAVSVSDLAAQLEESDIRMKSFSDSFKTDFQLAQDMARDVGTELVGSMSELMNMSQRLENDTDGLTAADYELLMANKALVQTRLDEQAAMDNVWSSMLENVAASSAAQAAAAREASRQVSIKMWTDRIDVVQTAINETQNNISALNSAISSTQSNVSSLASQIESSHAALASALSAIESTKEQIIAQEKAIALQHQRDTVQVKITDLEAVRSSLSSQISEVESSRNSLEGAISSMAQQLVSDAEAKKSDIESQLSALEDTRDAQIATLEQIEKDSLSSVISDLNDHLGDLNSSISTMESLSDTLRSKFLDSVTTQSGFDAIRSAAVNATFDPNDPLSAGTYSTAINEYNTVSNSYLTESNFGSKADYDFAMASVANDFAGFTSTVDTNLIALENLKAAVEADVVVNQLSLDELNYQTPISESDLALTERQLSNMRSELETAESNLAAVLAHTDPILGAEEASISALVELQRQLAVDDQQLDSLRAQLATADNSLETLQYQLSQLSDSGNTQEESLQKLKDQLSEQEEAYSQQQQQLAEQKAAYALETSILAKHQASLAAQENILSQQEKELETAQGNLEAVQSIDDTLDDSKDGIWSLHDLTLAGIDAQAIKLDGVIQAVNYDDMTIALGQDLMSVSSAINGTNHILEDGLLSVDIDRDNIADIGARFDESGTLVNIATYTRDSANALNVTNAKMAEMLQADYGYSKEQADNLISIYNSVDSQDGFLSAISGSTSGIASTERSNLTKLTDLVAGRYSLSGTENSRYLGIYNSVADQNPILGAIRAYTRTMDTDTSQLGGIYGRLGTIDADVGYLGNVSNRLNTIDGDTGNLGRLSGIDADTSKLGGMYSELQSIDNREASVASGVAGTTRAVNDQDQSLAFLKGTYTHAGMIRNNLKAQNAGWSKAGHWNIPGYAEGGYTGDGGKYRPAGIVHAGEIVFSQQNNADWGGWKNVEALRTGGLKVQVDTGVSSLAKQFGEVVKELKESRRLEGVLLKKVNEYVKREKRKDDEARESA